MRILFSVVACQSLYSGTDAVHCFWNMIAQLGPAWSTGANACMLLFMARDHFATNRDLLYDRARSA